ncbi:YceI family protein [Roseibium sp. RKSG952]|uniref:YceI family protein n=1 Tax=Roseibium sp. RKSG952 TaxID=2529384 RepID=UPI0012BBF265|nr:YceI family protein [Roseibium sp. RKSG952]MTH99674.1 YceI family protein [Roseibium sp. RKSG952]
MGQTISTHRYPKSRSTAQRGQIPEKEGSKIALSRRSVIAGIALLPVAQVAQAALSPYALVPSGTTVSFSFNLSGVAQTGTMPIQSANIRIDTNRLQNSRVDVVMNVAKARTKLPFAQMPMLSPSVLDAARFPTIRFVSTKIQLGPGGRISNGASITGNVTVRGVTRPITLQANLYRQSGSDVKDLDRLFIHLKGALNRHDFGASGYPDLVQDTVGLNIRAEILRQT